ncbi:MAG: diacylglycerol kinase family lipid kinase [Planctomycetes bacterium]|nr:diacylglycerol kinase family lipid kinase [Planctomycetota bacterium]
MSIACRSIKIIANPISGKGRSLKILGKIENLLSRESVYFETIRTGMQGDATNSAAVLAGFDAVIGIGGDGTINEIISGMLASNPVPLLVIPVGTGNVIAKELGLHCSAFYAEKLLTSFKIRLLDVGICGNGRCFVSMLGAGFDGSVVREFHGLRKGTTNHIMQYLPFALNSALRYKFPRITVKADGKVITDSAGFVQVANARSYGGPFVFAPGAVPDDGLLDVVWFKGHGFPGVFKLFWAAFLRDPLRRAGAKTIRARHIELSSSSGTPVQLDGDPAGFLPVSITIKPGAIPFLVK